ncbi:MAG: peptidoglycan DD-metalloendopeptidase family protein [Meiothermus sp.]|uniref:peptidoglycan DD-metalloendopeptidase family protein n=1 Tax=Meiothermus sp. TaxID=1955249 RepID=UPI0025D73335|nr:peptidoglycan DD-metalloendopeptidase family protein [Meiothermus sp.]MCS7194814.1 peptidoglycan DD-metalloendopeptidase family protein [Meiothermus sp.]MCX7740981.1 peptidoglycan DD-metalloendopeptidase family protein [Meiothermus sp.]MDW8090346.1 peptidoglycan DD-metalloendopeptidase family protein [Meiothermus sp.]MDW8481155.1 peptidoglycan DD-metalloendopeptidase family protein [Meiothermus sp.]
MSIGEVLGGVLATGVLGLLQPNLPGTKITVDAPARKGWVLYTVQPGDTLAAIAHRYRVDLRAIMYSSGLQSDHLRPGQLLRIPLVDDASSQVRLPPGVRPYVVRSGDTTESIARRFGLTLLGLVSANPDLKSLDRLEVGSTLYIPTGEPGLLVRLRPGETIHDLAQRYRVPLLVVARANGLTSPTEVGPGDLVLLPGVQARATYERLLQIQEAERKAREEERRRLAEERRRQEEARRRQMAERQARLQTRSPAQGQPQLRRANAVVAAAGYRWPMTSFTVTTYFGRRGAFQRFHTGIDLAAPVGTPIYAARAGQVGVAGWSRFGYGLHVVLDHGGGQETLYGHMSRIAVRPGQWVERGQIIGYVGSTGWSTGPHLHFEVRVGGVPRNPLAFLP